MRFRALLPTSRWTSTITRQYQDGDEAVVCGTGTLVLPFERRRLLRYLPSKVPVAEIGVAQGEFSGQIRFICRPALLVLIDPWCSQDEDTYFRDPNNVAQKAQDHRYQRVRGRFASQAAGRECRVLRQFSEEAAPSFPDGSFGWVYIDANHSYEQCLNDLRLWSRKVHDDGLICGHDFAAHAVARHSRFGVVEAVWTFVKETGFGLVALTLEPFPTYVIAKRPAGPTARRMRDLLLTYERNFVQVSSWDAAMFRHARVLKAVGRSTLVSFDFQRRGEGSASLE
jgi:hypothetical protein